MTILSNRVWSNTPYLTVAFCLLIGDVTELFAQPIFLQEQQAIQQAVTSASDSVVRIETVGGVDLVGKLLTGTGPTTGVVLREDGYIITSSFNFVSNPASVLVTLPNEERFAAQVVATDHSKMLTLLKIEQSGLSPLEAVSRKEIQVGQRAIALGRTFDLEFPNIATGIISALNRIQGRAIQTDAKTSPVNYGGPLIDLYGRCLGVIVPLSSQGEGETAGVELYDSGIGFAIPLEDIQRVADRLIAGEDLHRGLLGIGFEESGPIAKEAKILRVRPRSPADEAGLQSNDVITQIDETAIRRLNDLKQVLGDKYAGEVVSLRIQRGDEELTRKIELTDKLLAYEFPSLGILPTRDPVDGDVAGVGVRYVFDESPAAQTELKQEDRILKFNSESIATADDLVLQLQAVSVGDEVELEVLRGEATLTLTATLESLPDGENLPNLPPATLQTGETPEETEVGRFNEQLPGTDKNFWAYVPQSYVPTNRYGLLVWLHPPGDTMEAEIMRAWQDLADERGLIIAAPKAETVSGFSETDEEFAKDTAEWVIENYSVEPARVAVMGTEDSAVFATQVAFKYRDLFRGLISVNSPLRFPPPDNDPNHRLLIAHVVSANTQFREQIEKSVEFLRTQKYPTAILENDEPELFALDIVDAMIQWLDAIDRL